MFQFEFSLKYCLFKGVGLVHIFRLDCVSPKSIGRKTLNPVKVVFNPLNFVSVKTYKQQMNADADLGYTSDVSQ